MFQARHVHAFSIMRRRIQPQQQPTTTNYKTFSQESGLRCISSCRYAHSNAIHNDDTIIGRPSLFIYYNDIYHVELPPNHRFPMEMYGQVRRMVQAYLNQHHNTAIHCALQESPMATVAELSTTHCTEYIQRYMTGNLTKDEIRNVGFPWSQDHVRRSLSSVGGTIAAACAAINQQQQQQHAATGTLSPSCWGAHIAGGTHHAFHDRGEGFCVFSDIAVAANLLLQRYPDQIRRILILDLDVHQGNGNAVLFQNNPQVFTFSMHCQANYFSKKEKSDLDVELPVDCDDATYLMTLSHWLLQLENNFKGGSSFDAIFYQAGVDVLQVDRLGRMALSQKGVHRRNEMVYEFAWNSNVPLIITMGGGYPKTDDWDPILQAHANVYIQAHQFLLSKTRAEATTTR